MWRAYQSPYSTADCGPQWAQMPNLASRYHSGICHSRSDERVALNGPGAISRAGPADDNGARLSPASARGNGVRAEAARQGSKADTPAIAERARRLLIFAVLRAILIPFPWNGRQCERSLSMPHTICRAHCAHSAEPHTGAGLTGGGGEVPGQERRFRRLCTMEIAGHYIRTAFRPEENEHGATGSLSTGLGTVGGRGTIGRRIRGGLLEP